MAKIVLAGPANDPYFPRCELLADKLKAALPSFEVNKILIQPSDWEEWLRNTCSKFGWQRNEGNTAPLVWRELVTRGGKAVLIGGPNDFQEFCRTYYNVRSSLSTNYVLHVANENQNWTDIRDKEECEWLDRQIPIVVTAWNASANSAQLVLSQIGNGTVMPFHDFELRLTAAPWITNYGTRPSRVQTTEGQRVGANSSVESIIGESSTFVENLMVLEGIQLDLEDMANRNVRRILNCGANAITSAVGARLILIFVDDSCNNDAALESFTTIGRDLENTLSTVKHPTVDSYGYPSDAGVRVLFVANNVECMSQVLFHAASNFIKGILSTVIETEETEAISVNVDVIKKHKFSVDPAKVICLTSLLENAAKSLTAKQLNVSTHCINDMIIWSRPQSQGFSWPFYVDLSHATVTEHQGAINGPAPYTRSVLDLIQHERKFLTGINEAVSARYIISAGKSLSVTRAILEFIKSWFGGGDKHPNIFVEQYRRKRIFSAGICGLYSTWESASEHSNGEVTDSSSKAIITVESLTTFNSIPIRFTGRDDLEGSGYTIVHDLQPPADMFVLPRQQKPVEDEILPSRESAAEEQAPKEQEPTKPAGEEPKEDNLEEAGDAETEGAHVEGGEATNQNVEEAQVEENEPPPPQGEAEVDQPLLN